MSSKYLLFFSTCLIIGFTRESLAQRFFRGNGNMHKWGDRQPPFYNFHNRLPAGFSFSEVEWVCENPKTKDMMIIGLDNTKVSKGPGERLRPSQPSWQNYPHPYQPAQHQPQPQQPIYNPPSKPQPQPQKPGAISNPPSQTQPQKLQPIYNPTSQPQSQQPGPIYIPPSQLQPQQPAPIHNPSSQPQPQQQNPIYNPPSQPQPQESPITSSESIPQSDGEGLIDIRLANSRN